jgi:hypothetical protein
MSTTYLSIYDLLRITYTYEAQAFHAQARPRKDSACSVRSNFTYCCVAPADLYPDSGDMRTAPCAVRFTCEYRHPRDRLHTSILTI